MQTVPIDVYAFGNRSGPRTPRIEGFNVTPGRKGDLAVDATGILVPADEPQGMSTFGDLDQAELSQSPSAVALIRAGLACPAERAAALDAAALLPPDKKQGLFNDLLALASFAHGQIGAARDTILSLPHDWLLENIEQYAEPLLAYEDYEEYRRLLELYSLIDHDLTLRLARRAAAHSDADIREAGEDFIANPDPFRLDS